MLKDQFGLKKESAISKVTICQIAGREHAFKSAASRTKNWAELCHGTSVRVKREPRNKHDKNACAILMRGKKIGYVPREMAKVLSKRIDKGADLKFVIADFGFLSGGIRNSTHLSLMIIG